MPNDAIEVQAARPEEADALLRVLCAAFALDLEAARPVFYADPFFDLSHKRVLRTRAAGIVSCLTVIPSSVRIGGAVVPMGGIAGVATHPDFQKRGYASRLLVQTVDALADELAYPLSALFPYSYDYYRRFGWETASGVTLWTIAQSQLPTYAESVCMRPVSSERGADRSAIHQIYAEATKDRTGAFVRDGRRWRVIDTLVPGREAVVYDGPDGVTGYLLYERLTAQEDPAGQTLRIHEIHGLTPDARRGLVGYLACLGQRCAQLEWPASRRDMREFGLSGLTSAGDSPVTEDPGVMLRIVDLPLALEAVYDANLAAVLAEAAAPLTIRAQDLIRPKNTRPVRLTASGVMTGTDDDPAWIAADIRTLAQLYTGYRIPSEAAALGLLQSSSLDALATADRLFPAREPYIAVPDQF